jgi:hypothetical protein
MPDARQMKGWRVKPGRTSGKSSCQGVLAPPAAVPRAKTSRFGVFALPSSGSSELIGTRISADFQARIRADARFAGRVDFRGCVCHPTNVRSLRGRCPENVYGFSQINIKLSSKHQTQSHSDRVDIQAAQQGL